MYCELDIIDFTAGPHRFQTDHRTREQIEREPELSVLFALTRLLNARRHDQAMRASVLLALVHLIQRPWRKPVYVAVSDLPPFLEDAIAAAGGVVEHPDTHVRYMPPRPIETASELADRAFRALAERVRRRLAIADPTAALRALEAEILASPTPDDDVVGEDEDGDGALTFWTRICELCALTGEVLRARVGGAWIEAAHTVIPFGFACHKHVIVVPANGAHRFLNTGRPETLFRVIDQAQRAVAAARAR